MVSASSSNFSGHPLAEEVTGFVVPYSFTAVPGSITGPFDAQVWGLCIAMLILIAVFNRVLRYTGVQVISVKTHWKLFFPLLIGIYQVYLARSEQNNHILLSRRCFYLILRKFPGQIVGNVDFATKRKGTLQWFIRIYSIIRTAKCGINHAG